MTRVNTTLLSGKCPPCSEFCQRGGAGGPALALCLPVAPLAHASLPFGSWSLVAMVADVNPLCPPSAPFFGFMGAAVALMFP